jgi:hypothetical protein
MGLSTAGLVASAAAVLCARTRAAQRALGAWRGQEAGGSDDCDGPSDRTIVAASIVTEQTADNGPGAYALDYPLREGVGDAELTLKPDGSWSVAFTVIPVRVAEDEEEESEPSDLPPLVALVRTAIAEAARARDYEALEQLAFTFGDEFTYSFDEPTVEGSPGHFWRELEDQGDDVLTTLKKLLEMPYAHLDGVYVWPSVAIVPWSEVSRRDREALRRGFGDEQICFWEEFGAYIDYRVGITSQGDWRFFVAGD